jgi:hypothetical protein
VTNGFRAPFNICLKFSYLSLSNNLFYLFFSLYEKVWGKRGSQQGNPCAK